MNKKAIAMGYGAIIAAVIGMIIIALVIGGPLRGVYNVVGEKIFGAVSPDSEKEFIPYVVNASVYDSVHAFVCGVNLVADRSLDFKKNCPNINLNPAGNCKGPHYGRVCVDCEKVKSDAVACDIIGFELKQDIDMSWAQYFIQGIGDPEFLFYYESFPKGEDRYWSANMFSTDTFMIAMSGVVSFAAGPAGGLGRTTKTAIRKRVGKQAIKAALKEPFQFMLTPVKYLLSPFKSMARLYANVGAKKATKIKLFSDFLKEELAENVPELFAKGYGRKADDLVVELSEFIGKDGAIKASRGQVRDKIVRFLSRNYDEFGLTARGTVDLTKITKNADELTDGIMKFAPAVSRAEMKFADQLARKGALKKMVDAGSLRKSTLEQMSKQIDALGSFPPAAAAKEHAKIFKNVNNLLKNVDDVETAAMQAALGAADQAAQKSLSRKVFDFIKAPGKTTVIWGGKRLLTLPRDHKLFAVLASGFFASMVDAQGQKYKDGGTNSLFLSESPYPAEEFPLRRSDTPMLRLSRGQDYSPPTRRFHLVSPCKADLTIKGDDPANCYVQPENINKISLYNFPEGIMPARAESLIFLNVTKEMDKMYNLLDSQVKSITWQSVPLPAGKPNIVYKRVGDVLYAKDSANNIYKIDKHTGRFFAVGWGYEQGSAIYAAVLAKGANTWWNGHAVGGKSDWVYAVIDNDLVAKKGNQYRVFANSRFTDVNDITVKKWDANRIETYIQNNPKYFFTTKNAFLDYHLAKTKFDILFNLNGVFFPTFHHMETIYGLNNTAYAGESTTMIQNAWLVTANQSAENLELQYYPMESDVANCVNGTASISLCKTTKEDLLKLIQPILDEDAPQYYPDRYLNDLIKWQTEYWLIAKKWDRSAIDKYKLVRNSHDACIKEMQNPTNFASCHDFEKNFDALLTELKLMDGFVTNKGKKTFHDYYYVLNQTSNQRFLRKRAVRMHRTIADLAPHMVKYHRLADDELMYFASIVHASKLYEKELDERKNERKRFVADIHKANVLKDKCIQVPYNSPVAAYNPCRQALNIYSKYAVKDRERIQMSLLFEYDTEIESLMMDADAGIIQIFDAPVTQEPYGWAKELFRRLQRYNHGDPGTGCILRGRLERGIPKFNRALEKKYGVLCRVESYEAIMDSWSSLKVFYNPPDANRALLESLYFAGNTTTNTPYFEVREQLITNPKEVMKLTNVFNWAQRLNQLDFQDVNYQITKLIVTDQFKRKVLGLEREWSPSEIVMFVDQKNKDCIKADAETSFIRPLSYYYTNVMKQSIFNLCQNGYGGLYPAFLEAQLVPDFYSLRPGMTDFINFDHNQIPELRRIATDNVLDKRSYPDLLTKKDYVGRLSGALELAEQDAFLADQRRFLNQNIGIDFGRTHNQITRAELDHWIEASERLFTEYNPFIDAEFATKTCNKPEGTPITSNEVYNPKIILVSADRSKYSAYNKGVNYCYGGKLGTFEKFLKGAIYFSAFFLDPVVYVTVEVATKGVARGWAGKTALLVKGGAEAFFLEKIDQQVAWPNSPS